MARKKILTKKNKNILTGVLCGALGIMAIGGVAALTDGFENFNVKSWVASEVLEVKDYDFEFVDSTESLTKGFMYSDEELFEEKTIYKVGLPISSIEDYTEDSVFTISVVKYADALGSTQTKVLDEIELEIKADTYNRNEINEWVYFNVEIEVGKGETLVFGQADDTITLAYDVDGKDKEFKFMTGALTGNATEETGSLVIDVRALNN